MRMTSDMWEIGVSFYKTHRVRGMNWHHSKTKELKKSKGKALYSPKMIPRTAFQEVRTGSAGLLFQYGTGFVERNCPLCPNRVLSDMLDLCKGAVQWN